MSTVLERAFKSSQVEQTEMPPVLERFEAKYTIPFSFVEPICRYVSPYCTFDKHSQMADDNFYKVNSLYFDSPNYYFLRQRMAKAENRFNMRIRSYGAIPSPPFFLEIKQRRGDTVLKYRSKYDALKIDIDQLRNSQYSKECNVDIRERENRNLFIRAMMEYNASPVVHVQYSRLALFSEYDSYARVTFDKSLHYLPYSGNPEIASETSFIRCDTNDAFDSGTDVVLELKCFTSQVPLWMIDLVKNFNLNRRGFSKYSTCIKPICDKTMYNTLFFQNSVLEKNI